jgi:hypothetical protein
MFHSTDLVRTYTAVRPCSVLLLSERHHNPSRQWISISLLCVAVRSMLARIASDQSVIKPPKSEANRQRSISYKVQRVSQPKCRSMQVLSKALLPRSRIARHANGYVISQSARPQTMYRGEDASSKPKIHDLEPLLNHNIRPIHVQRMACMHKSLRLLLVDNLQCMPRRRRIASNALLLHR